MIVFYRNEGRLSQWEFLFSFIIFICISLINGGGWEGSADGPGAGGGEREVNARLCERDSSAVWRRTLGRSRMRQDC